jgi:glutamate racemase
MGNQITLVDSAQETASQIKDILSKENLLNKNNSQSKREFYLTDISDTFLSVAGRFLGEKIAKIEMVDIVGTTNSAVPIVST